MVILSRKFLDFVSLPVESGQNKKRRWLCSNELRSQVEKLGFEVDFVLSSRELSKTINKTPKYFSYYEVKKSVLLILENAEKCFSFLRKGKLMELLMSDVIYSISSARQSSLSPFELSREILWLIFEEKERDFSSFSTFSFPVCEVDMLSSNCIVIEVEEKEIEKLEDFLSKGERYFSFFFCLFYYCCIFLCGQNIGEEIIVDFFENLQKKDVLGFLVTYLFFEFNILDAEMIKDKSGHRLISFPKRFYFRQAFLNRLAWLVDQVGLKMKRISVGRSFKGIEYRRIEISKSDLKVLGENLFDEQYISDLLLIYDRNFEIKAEKRRIYISVPLYYNGLKTSGDLLAKVFDLHFSRNSDVFLPLDLQRNIKSFSTDLVDKYEDEVVEKNIKSFFVSRGFFEVNLYMLTSQDKLLNNWVGNINLKNVVNFGAKESDERKISNPISSYHRYVRSSAALQLIGLLQKDRLTAEYHPVEPKIFCLTNVSVKGQKKNEDIVVVTSAYIKEIKSYLELVEEINLVKGIAESVIKLKGEKVRFELVWEEILPNFFSSEKDVECVLGMKNKWIKDDGFIGFVGVVGINNSKRKIIFIEENVSCSASLMKNSKWKKFEEKKRKIGLFVKFGSIIRDITFSIYDNNAEDLNYQQIINRLEKLKTQEGQFISEMIEAKWVKDVFWTGKGPKKLTVRLVFNSHTHQLTNKEVNEFMKIISTEFCLEN